MSTKPFRASFGLAISSRRGPNPLGACSGRHRTCVGFSHRRLVLGRYPGYGLLRFVRYYRWYKSTAGEMFLLTFHLGRAGFIQNMAATALE